MSATTRGEEKKRAHSRDQGRILLISEDARVVAHAAALEGAGFVVAGVSGGAKALIALQRTRPHVVIADARLRGISARDLGRVLNDAQETTPLILVGDERADVARRAGAMEAGASDYFEVPAELALVVARARQLVAHRQLVDKLRAEADRDYLTGLANRRRFRKALGQEVERWRRYKVPCALLLVDIDHLKKVNDAHGHSTGDRAIRAVAEALAFHSRDNDTAARLGGEEFALLLAGADCERAFAAAERLRLSVAAEPVGEAGLITVSLGVAACPAHAQTERTLYAASDRALYRAKHEGRNRTAIAAGDGHP